MSFHLLLSVQIIGHLLLSASVDFSRHSSVKLLTRSRLMIKFSKTPPFIFNSFDCFKETLMDVYKRCSLKKLTFLNFSLIKNVPLPVHIFYKLVYKCLIPTIKERKRINLFFMCYTDMHKLIRICKSIDLIPSLGPVS